MAAIDCPDSCTRLSTGISTQWRNKWTFSQPAQHNERVQRASSPPSARAETIPQQDSFELAARIEETGTQGGHACEPARWGLECNANQKLRDASCRGPPDEGASDLNFGRCQLALSPITCAQSAKVVAAFLAAVGFSLNVTAPAGHGDRAHHFSRSRNVLNNAAPIRIRHNVRLAISLLSRRVGRAATVPMAELAPGQCVCLLFVAQIGRWGSGWTSVRVT
jgi:hypothetical protein